MAEKNDPLGRQIGAPLWPEWEDLQSLERKRTTVGERTWSALFQQAPRPNEGTLFKVERLMVTERAHIDPADLTVRAWDLAATENAGSNDPDWTVGLKLACSQSGHYTILDVVRMRGSPHQVEEVILATARGDGPHVTIGLPEDPGQAGKTQVTYLTARLAGYHVHSTRETGAKFTRAMPVASQIEAGNVTILRDTWNQRLIEELGDFPSGRKDDQVDALSRAFTTIITMPKAVRNITVGLIGR